LFDGARNWATQGVINYFEIFFRRVAASSNKAFYGTSDNAVKTQIWIAVCVYLLVAIVKKRMQVSQSLYTILLILSVTLFHKKPLYQAFAESGYKSKVSAPIGRGFDDPPIGGQNYDLRA
jgi:hypothetical protein